MDSESNLPTTQPNDRPSSSDPLGPRFVPPVYDVSQQPDTEPAVVSQDVTSLDAQQSSLDTQPVTAEPPTQLQTPYQDEGLQEYTSASTQQAPAETMHAPTVQPAYAAQTQAVQQQPSAQTNFTSPPNDNRNTVLPNPNSESKYKKIVLLAIAAIGGLLAIGFGALLVMNLFGGNTVKLQEYSDDNFSISYPVDMVVVKNDLGIEISEANDTDESEISVVKPLLPSTSAREAIALYSEQIIKQADEDENVTITSSQNTKINGVPAAIITAQEKSESVVKDGKIVLITSSDDKVLYLLTFENHPDGIDVIGASDDILKSFAIKSDKN